jgi:hypothetical protein
MLQILLLAAAAAMQGTDAHSHGDAMGPGVTGGIPLEPGQETFAAIGEIVGILTANPSTDWTKVSIEALRAHLIDMDNVMMMAKSATEKLPDGARFRVTGSGDVIGSIQRMTRSHFVVENVPGDWTITTSALSDGATVTVTSDIVSEAQRIQALGFFGILTLGSHHQRHHLMIAQGMHH